MNSTTKNLPQVFFLFFLGLAWTGCVPPPVKEEPMIPVVEVVEAPPVVEAQIVEEKVLRYGDEKQPADIYTSPKGRIYVKSKTPIYLSIATSISGDDGREAALRNEASKNGKSRPKPFYFEGHGKHSLVHPPADRHKAHKQGGPNLFYVFVDGKAPVIKYSTSPVPKVKRKGVTILGKPADVKLNFYDKNAGLFSKYVSLDGESYRTYEGPISLTREEDYILKYYALDNVGNRSKEYQKAFSLDFTPPESSYEIVNIYRTPEDEVVLSPRSVISLSSKDNRAGVKGVYYKFGKKVRRFTRGVPIRLTKFSDGPKKLTFFAKDRVGNVEEMKEIPFYLDRKAPNLRFSVDGDQHRRKKTLFVSGRSKGELTATDNKAGVKEIRYYRGKKGKAYTEPFSFPKRNGKYVFGYSARDNVRNRTKKRYRKVVVDISSPKSKVSFKGPHYYSRKTHYIRKRTKVSLYSSDNLSGIKTRGYTLDGGYEIDYKKSFNIADEGEHILSFHAVDNVNNVADDKKTTLYVDEQAPEIFPHFSVESTVFGEKIYPKKTKLYLAATDEQSGVKTIYYRINKGKERVYNKPLYFAKNRNYRVKIRAIDRVGNVAKSEIKFRVK